MKQGIKDVQFWTEDDRLVAVCLGWDFYAEHEWGINGIKRTLGIDQSREPGLPRRTVGRGVELKEGTVTVKDREHGKQTLHGLYLGYGDPDWKRYAAWLREPTDHGHLVGWWDGDDFCMLTTNEGFRDSVRDAFASGDAAVWVGAAGPFGNGGLVLAIASRLPAGFVDEMRALDEDTDLLKATAEQTGIEEELRKAGKGWYALSPRWADDEKTTVAFWLNPTDQKNNNYGQFTVSELREWIRGRGPIPKEPVVEE